MTRFLVGCVALTLAAGPSGAQDPAAKLNPPINPGDPLPGPFRSYIVSDERTEPKNSRNRTNKQHCLVCEADLNPTAAVFFRTVPADSNAAPGKLLKRLDTLVQDHKADRVGAFAIFLTLAADYPLDETRDEKAKAVKDLSALVKVPNVPFGLAGGKSDAAVAYGIKDEHDTTVLLFSRAKVVKRWAFAADKPLTDADVEAILSAAKELAK